MKVCFQCGRENADATFCGGCGAALDLKDYVAASIRQQLESRDKTIVEADSAGRVYERVIGWVKNWLWALGVFAALLAVMGVWRVSDFWSGVESAKKAVVDTSKSTKEEISKTSTVSLGEIKKAVAGAKETISGDLKQASEQSGSFKKAVQTETRSFQTDMADSRKQLQEAKTLQPEMVKMRKDLEDALAQIRQQQAVIASSEEFAKSVFSSHKNEFFTVGHDPSSRVMTVEHGKDSTNSYVLMVLAESPIRETLQIQFRVFTQPANTYVTIHNLVIFGWGEALANLQNQQLSVAYFPDKSDKEHITALSEHDDRIFADGEPLPYLTKPDPTFKGNRWFDLKDGIMNPKAK